MTAKAFSLKITQDLLLTYIWTLPLHWFSFIIHSFNTYWDVCQLLWLLMMLLAIKGIASLPYLLFCTCLLDLLPVLYTHSCEEPLQQAGMCKLPPFQHFHLLLLFAIPVSNSLSLNVLSTLTQSVVDTVFFLSIREFWFVHLFHQRAWFSAQLAALISCSV